MLWQEKERAIPMISADKLEMETLIYRGGVENLNKVVVGLRLVIRRHCQTFMNEE